MPYTSWLRSILHSAPTFPRSPRTWGSNHTVYDHIPLPLLNHSLPTSSKSLKLVHPPGHSPLVTGDLGARLPILFFTPSPVIVLGDFSNHVEDSSYIWFLRSPGTSPTHPTPTPFLPSVMAPSLRSQIQASLFLAAISVPSQFLVYHASSDLFGTSPASPPSPHPLAFPHSLPAQL